MYGFWTAIARRGVRPRSARRARQKSTFSPVFVERASISICSRGTPMRGGDVREDLGLRPRPHLAGQRSEVAGEDEQREPSPRGTAPRRARPRARRGCPGPGWRRRARARAGRGGSPRRYAPSDRRSRHVSVTERTAAVPGEGRATARPPPGTLAVYPALGSPDGVTSSDDRLSAKIPSAALAIGLRPRDA